ncbi:MAG: trimeric autotransporter adhesin [Patescibacteria group bacterium]|nr:trimeric autotransporter adhesin [Patescibacteria group bacterium]
MNNKNKTIFKSFFIIFVFALAIQVSAVWTNPPPGTPPANNIPPPINTGIDAQMKNGAFGAQGIRAVGPLGLGLFDKQLGIGSVSGVPHMPATDIELDVLGDIKFSGALMPNGNAGTDGFFLKSKGSGVAPEWVAGSGGGSLWVRTGTLLSPLNPNDDIGISDSAIVYKGVARFIYAPGTNLFMGKYAGNLSLTGSANMGFGEYSLDALTSGNSNSAFGPYSLGNLGTGSNNASLGNGGLAQLTSGDRNVSIGIESGDEINSGDDNIFIGYNAASNLGSSGSKNIIIGTSTCTASGSESYSDNVFLGYNAGCDNETGINNVAVGRAALDFPTTGSNNTAVGAYSDISAVNLNNATAIGYQASVNASNKIVLGNTSVTSIGGYAIFTNYSDLRLKENVEYKKDLGLNFISKLKTVSYNYKDDENKVRRDGLIAQDVKKVLDELGLEFSGLVIDKDEMGTMNLSYDSLVIPLINSVQEQQKQIEDLKAEIEILKNK